MSHSAHRSQRCFRIALGTVLAVTLVKLSPDRAEAIGTIYWSTDRIDRASTTGQCRQMVQPSATNSNILDIDVDPETGKVYFPFRQTNGNATIRRCDLDGASVEVLHTNPFPAGPGIWVLDIDRVNRKLYWTETGAQSRIMRANLDGSNAAPIVSGMVNAPRGIATYPEGGKVYWTHGDFSTSSGEIHRANLDGTSPEHIAVSGQVPWGIAVHHATAKVYWTNGNGGIYRANLDLTRMEQLSTAPQGLRHLDIDEVAGMLYLGTEVQPQGVYRCDLNGGGLARLTTVGAFGVAVVSEEFGFECPGDSNSDLLVNIDDLVNVITSWGPCRSCPADLTGDDVVNIDDLVFVVTHWTN